VWIIFSSSFGLFYVYRLSDLGIQVWSILTPGGQGSSQVSGSSQISSKDAFLSKAEAKTISEVNKISEVKLLFILTINSVQWKT